MAVDIAYEKIPSTPGVYFFKNARGAILYIGKATNLKQRLVSYFQKSAYLDPAKKRMIAEAKTVTWCTMASEVEALIEEARLIKSHRPKYNILMRDDKNHLFIGFTKEIFPRIIYTHQPSKFLEQMEYIGPFTDAGIIKRALRSLRRVFPYCTCRQIHTRPCQAAELELCLGMCCYWRPGRQLSARDAKLRMYQNNIRNIKKILLGKRTQLTKHLQKEMIARSKAKNFETAARLRDQIRGLERIFAHSPFLKKEFAVENEKALRELALLLQLKEIPRRIEGYDISNIQGKFAVGSMVVFSGGLPDKNEYRKFKIRTVRGANDVAMLREVLARRFRNTAWPEPDIMLIDGGRPQLNTALAVRDHSLHEKNIKLLLRNSPKPSPPFAKATEGSPRLHPYSKLQGIRRRRIKMIAIAKREEELYVENEKNPIRLKEASISLLHLLQQIRNEAHRFAISYYRKLHSTLN